LACEENVAVCAQRERRTICGIINCFLKVFPLFTGIVEKWGVQIKAMSLNRPAAKRNAEIRVLEDRVFPLEKVDLPDQCAQILAYWQICAERDHREIPRRRDIDPVELVAFLPSIALVDVMETLSRRDFRIRVLGTRLTRMFGEQTGKLISETPLSLRKVNVYDRVVLERSGFYVHGTLWFLGKGDCGYSELCLPLTNDRTEIDKILIFVEFKS
jgi:hypothetical protein